MTEENCVYIVKYTILPSNKLHYIKNLKRDVSLGIRCEVHTSALTIPYLSPDRVRRLELLSELYDQGLSDKQISQLFNRIELTTPQNKTYTPSLVWITRKKWRVRQLRWVDTRYVIYCPQFYLKQRRRKSNAQ